MANLCRVIQSRISAKRDSACFLTLQSAGWMVRKILIQNRLFNSVYVRYVESFAKVTKWIGFGPVVRLLFQE